MYDKDLFVDDENDNQLDFLRQNRNQRPAQQYNRKNIEQDIKVVDEDDDFNYQFEKKKPQREEEPQRLEDLLGNNNEEQPQPEYYNRTQAARQKMGARPAQTRYSQNVPQNADNFLYQSNEYNKQPSFGSNYTGETDNFGNYNREDDNQGTSTGFGSRPTTSGGRPGTSTSMNARAKLAEQQRARLAQSKTITAEGGLVTNEMLRTSKTNDLYRGANYEVKQSTTSSGFFYDPSMQSMGQSNLPVLGSNKVVIKYKEDDDPRQSNLRDHYEAPPQQEHFQDYKQLEPDSPKVPQYNREMSAKSEPEEEKAPTPMEAREEKESSDEEPEPNKEEMKALERQRKELNKQQDAEIAVVNNDSPDANEALSKVLNLDIRDIADMKAFLMSPCPKGYRIECTIKRDRSGLNRFYPKYHCYISNGPQYLMSGKKRGQNKTSNYLIAYHKDVKKNSPYCLGKVRSNFMGTEFNIFDEGLNPSKAKDIERLRSNLGVVLYESNLLSAKGPRKMKVYAPEVNENTSEIYQFKPLSEKEGILSNFKTGKRAGIKEFTNKNPKWNDQLQAFVLNFNGRVEKPSVKNFQLIDERSDDRIYLQFGRVTNDTFNMDFEWPLSPFQAFAICLSSFDYKIACE